MELNALSSQVIKAAINVHAALGPGLLETVYQKCMTIELNVLGLDNQTEVSLPVFYRDQKISDDGFRIDILVEETIVVELKSVELVRPVHKKQLLTYLRLSEKPLGLLINFNETLLKDGITRIVTENKIRPLAESQRSQRKALLSAGFAGKRQNN
jgi:GxxExxY protein